MTVPSPAMWAQFTKLRLWEQMQYEKIVYLDSDIIVVADISALFDILRSPLAAARGTLCMHRFVLTNQSCRHQPDGTVQPV